MKQYSLAVLGATGFAGRALCLYLSKLLSKRQGTVHWLIAGRSMQKLEALANELDRASKPNILVVDIQNQEQLNTMCMLSAVVINCAGPYTWHGEPVVAACIQGSTHYVDLGEEKLFVEQMESKYSLAACSKGVYVLTGCGFETFVSEMAVMHINKTLQQSKRPRKICKIDEYIDLPGQKSRHLNCGTYTSFVLDMAGRRQTRRDTMETLTLLQRILRHLPRPVFGQRKWKVLLGTDCARYANTKAQQDKAFSAAEKYAIDEYLLVGTVQMIFFSISFACCSLLALFSPTRRLLLLLPRLFSSGMFKSLSAEELQNTSFKTTFVATLHSRQAPAGSHSTLKTVASGPGIYTTTAACAVICAEHLLSKAPTKGSGGVLTPGTAFKNEEALVLSQALKHGVGFHTENEDPRTRKTK